MGLTVSPLGQTARRQSESRNSNSSCDFFRAPISAEDRRGSDPRDARGCRSCRGSCKIARAYDVVDAMKIGDLVLTVRPDKPTSGWTRDTIQTRKFGLRGVIVSTHSGHGQVFGVNHGGGGVGYYEDTELEVVGDPKHLDAFRLLSERAKAVGMQTLYHALRDGNLPALRDLFNDAGWEIA